MIKALIRVRFRALFAALFQQSRRKRRQSKGMAVLFAILFIYVAFVFFGLFTIMFQQLVEPYHALGLDWLYFATAGLTGLAFSILGSVFATQSQLYDAKDNDLLLSMPIRPRLILFSRMVPLLALNLLFSAMSMVPAGVIYGANVGFAPGGFVAYLLSTLALPFLAQAITCLLGWLLHQLLQRMNKSLASALYLLVFMAVYFYVYTQASQLLNAMASNGEAMANALRSWAWPLYAMGQGCTGGLPFLAGFLAVTAAAFGLVYWFLSVTFMHSAFLRRSVKKGRKVDFGRLETRSAVQALHRREMKRFLGCPAYLTNLGFGLVMIAAVAVAGLIFRRQILDFLNLIPELNALAPLLVAACLGFMISCTCISTPSVSLEGKTIWFLQSMPLTPRQILLSKLWLHCVLVVPLSALSGLVLALAYGFSPVDTVLSALCPAALGFLCGVLGLVCGLQWVRLDWLSEAYPCKQSVALMVTMFGLMGLLLIAGLLYGFVLYSLVSATVFLAGVTLVLLLLFAILYRPAMTWGVKTWQAL